MEHNLSTIYDDVQQLLIDVASLQDEVTEIQDELSIIQTTLASIATWQTSVDAALYDSGWQNLQLNSGWTNPYGYDVAQYRKIGKVVYLRGLINGTEAAGATIATLPEGYRPGGRYQRFICCKDQANTVPVEISYTGTLSDYTKTSSTYREFISLYNMFWVVAD